MKLGKNDCIQSLHNLIKVIEQFVAVFSLRLSSWSLTMASSSLCRRRHQLNEIMRKNIGVVVVGVSVFVGVLWVDVAVLFTRRQHYIASSSSTSSLLFSLLFPRCCCHHRCQWRYLRRRRRQRRLRSGMECEYLGSAKYLWATIVLWLSRDVFFLAFFLHIRSCCWSYVFFIHLSRFV